MAVFLVDAPRKVELGAGKVDPLESRVSGTPAAAPPAASHLDFISTSCLHGTRPCMANPGGQVLQNFVVGGRICDKVCQTAGSP
jgi:hypothetical protein